MKRIVAISVASALLAGCVLPGPKPQMARRFSRYGTAVQPAGSPLVSMTTFTLPVPPGEPQRGVLSLTERGQAELVRALAGKTEGAPALASALAMPFVRDGEGSSMIDRSRVKRRVVFSVDHLNPQPADRVSRARLRVRLASGAQGTPTFAAWNRVESEYQTIDLAKLTSTQSRTGSAELGLSLLAGPHTATPTVGIATEKALQEEVTIRQRYASLHGTLTPTEANLLEEGYTGVDLTGNVYADFEILLPFHDGQAYGFTYTSVDGSPNCAQRPNLRSFTLRFPMSREPVQADVGMDYVVRRVIRGEGTLPESDDWVTLVSGSDSVRRVTLVPTEELAVSVFELRSGANAVEIENPLVGTNLPKHTLRFATYEDAFRALNWLHRCNASIPGYTPYLSGSLLTPDGVRRLRIHNQALGETPAASAAGRD